MIGAIVTAVAVVTVLCTCAAGVVWLLGAADQPKLAACCPPGLGCNDPDDSRAHCRRRLAYRIADLDDGAALDRAWTELNAVSALHPYARRRALTRYARTRDGVIERRLREMSNQLHDRRLQLEPGEPAELPLHAEVLGALEDHRDVAKSLKGEIC